MRRRSLVMMTALACAVVVIGCARKRPPPRPRAPRVQAFWPPAAAAEAARRAVVAYIKHLQDGDYAAAHALLSAESRRLHPLAEFKRQAQAGITYFDLSSAAVKLTQPAGGAPPSRAQVTMRLESDPASATIVAVRESGAPPAGGAWRVVYVRGRPSFPYP